MSPNWSGRLTARCTQRMSHSLMSQRSELLDPRTRAEYVSLPILLSAFFGSLIRSMRSGARFWRATMKRSEKSLSSQGRSICSSSAVKPASRSSASTNSHGFSCRSFARDSRSKRLSKLQAILIARWPSRSIWRSDAFAGSNRRLRELAILSIQRRLKDDDMTGDVTANRPSARALGMLGRIRAALDGVSYTWLALPLRFAVATVFWNSAMAKLANWDTTLSLFSDEYQLPLLPPEIAAYAAATVELTTPVLLVLGLLARPAAFVLLGMTAVIEIFVYPQSWPTHVQWAAMLLVLLCRGAGALSLDRLLWRRLGPLAE